MTKYPKHVPRLLPSGDYIVLGLDGLTWESEPTTALEAGRIARALNKGTEPGDPDPDRLLTILDKLAGPDDVRLARAASRISIRALPQRGVFDQQVH